MNLTLNCKPNRERVRFVAGILPKTHNLPVLTHVRLGANDEEVSISATDLDVTLGALLDTRDGANTNTEPCLLPGRKFADFFKKGERITVESNCAKAAVTVDGNTFSMMQLRDDEWPKATAFTPDYEFDISAEMLARAIAHVRAAQSTDDSRYVLNGILFNLEPCWRRLVATDGRRLHLWERTCATDDAWQRRLVVAQEELNAMPALSKEREKAQTEHDEAKRIQFILPSDTVRHLANMVKAVGAACVRVEYKTGVTHRGEAANPKNAAAYKPDEPALVRFTADNLFLQTRCVHGSYPNFRQVIPTGDSIKERVAVDPEAWLAALRTVEPFTSEKCNSVKLKFTKHLLTMTTNSPDLGNAKATVLINYIGPDHGMAYNPAYLIEAFEALKNVSPSETIHFGFVDELSPCLISSPETTIVIMPMRLS